MTWKMKSAKNFEPLYDLDRLKFNLEILEPENQNSVLVATMVEAKTQLVLEPNWEIFW